MEPRHCQTLGEDQESFIESESESSRTGRARTALVQRTPDTACKEKVKDTSVVEFASRWRLAPRLRDEITAQSAAHDENDACLESCR